MEVAAPVLDVGRLGFSGAVVELVVALDPLLAAEAVKAEAEAKARFLLVPRLTKTAEQVLDVGGLGFLEAVAEPVGVQFVVVLVPRVVGAAEALEAWPPELLRQTSGLVFAPDLPLSLWLTLTQSPVHRRWRTGPRGFWPWHAGPRSPLP